MDRALGSHRHPSGRIISGRWLVTGALGGVVAYAVVSAPAGLQLVNPPGSAAWPAVELAVPATAAATIAAPAAPGPVPGAEHATDTTGPPLPTDPGPAPALLAGDPAVGAAPPTSPAQAPLNVQIASPSTEPVPHTGPADPRGDAVPDSGAEDPLPGGLPAAEPAPVTVVLSAQTAIREITISASILGARTGGAPLTGGRLISGRITTG